MEKILDNIGKLKRERGSRGYSLNGISVAAQLIMGPIEIEFNNLHSSPRILWNLIRQKLTFQELEVLKMANAYMAIPGELSYGKRYQSYLFFYCMPYPQN